MTDNEIIKSLSVHRDRFDYNCFGCSYRGIKCSFDLAGDAFDLINRQKAEIEMLRNYMHDNNLEFDLLSYSKRNGGDEDERL